LVRQKRLGKGKKGATVGRFKGIKSSNRITQRETTGPGGPKNGKSITQKEGKRGGRGTQRKGETPRRKRGEKTIPTTFKKKKTDKLRKRTFLNIPRKRSGPQDSRRGKTRRESQERDIPQNG